MKNSRKNITEENPSGNQTLASSEKLEENITEENPSGNQTPASSEEPGTTQVIEGETPETNIGIHRGSSCTGSTGRCRANDSGKHWMSSNCGLC